MRSEEEQLTLARYLADARTLPLYIGLVMRSMPIVRETIARVDSGALGEIVSMDATEHLHPEHGGYLARNWRRKRDWGGSYFLDKVCHDFDIFNRADRCARGAGGEFRAGGAFSTKAAARCNAYMTTARPPAALRDAGAAPTMRSIQTWT